MRSELEVYEILSGLRATRRIAWKLEVPAEGARPEQHLRRLIERVEDGRLRRSALAALDELTAAVAATSCVALSHEGARLACCLTPLVS